MEPLGVLYTVYIKYVEFDIKFLWGKKPDYALDHVPNALFTFTLNIQGKQVLCHLGNINRHKVLLLFML